jgi:ribosome biogenesis GTPase
MRELGLLGVDESIGAGFEDVEELFALCRFKDCRHQSEPGCAVLDALKNGSLPHGRWEQYRKQLRENKYADDRNAFVRENNAVWKAMTIQNRAGLKTARKGKK